MKDRLVFWGKKNEDQKVLITIDLNEDEGTYDVNIIRAGDVTEEFDNLVRNEWRNNSGNIVFPEIETEFTKELSLTQDLLPKEYEVDRDDLLKMAQAEWNFIVLSKRLKNTYNQELEEYEEEVGKLEEYNQKLWGNMKTFWSKVQKQIRERNLARRHGNDLRRRTNLIFSTLKSLRAKSEKEFVAESSTHKDQFINQLATIEKKVEDGQALRHLFEELKKIQNKFKNIRLTREDHSAVWDKLDGLFKDIKAKKYGKSASGNDPLVKNMRRVDGLNAAIDRMEKSIKRDQKELKYQKNKIEKAEGQLEAQIRQAKLSMLEERIHSKQLKLDDMNNTEKQLNQRIIKMKAKAEKEQAEQNVKDRIAGEIQAKQQKLDQDPKVQEAAAKITGKMTASEKDSVQETISIIGTAIASSQIFHQEEE